MSVRGGTLGCGDYEIAILSRGGATRLITVPWTTLKWQRRLDDTSQGGCTALPGGECCAELAAVRPWRHELAIYRDSEQIWVGPISNIAFLAESITIEARDLSAWWDKRRIHSDHDYAAAPTDLATIFTAISDDAMAPDPSPGLTVVTTPTGITGTQTFLAAQNLKAGPVLRDLSNIGIDWTVVNREALAGGIVVPTHPLTPIVDDYFVEPPTIEFDGVSQANNWRVRGAGGGAEGDDIIGSASDPGYATLDGLLEDVETNSTIVDVAAAAQAAASHLALSSSAVTLSSVRLTEAAPFPVTDLVPGALCPINLTRTCVPVVGLYRLQQIDGDAAGVTIAFQPAGTTRR